jgi:hypothetical protein
MGYGSDHPQYRECTLTVYQQAEGNRQAAARQLLQSGVQMMIESRPQPPVVVYPQTVETSPQPRQPVCRVEICSPYSTQYCTRCY